MKKRIQENKYFQISHDGIDYKCWIESNLTCINENDLHFRYFIMNISKKINKRFFNLFSYKSNYEFRYYLPNNIKYEVVNDNRFFKIDDVKSWLITGLNEHEQFKIKKANQKNELLNYKHIEKII